MITVYYFGAYYVGDNVGENSGGYSTIDGALMFVKRAIEHGCTRVRLVTEMGIELRLNDCGTKLIINYGEN